MAGPGKIGIDAGRKEVCSRSSRDEGEDGRGSRRFDRSGREPKWLRVEVGICPEDKEGNCLGSDREEGK